MDLIFQASHGQSLQDGIRNRIRAKAALYTFMGETLSEFIDTYTEDLAPELIRTCIRLLHPYFTGEEILDEAELLLKTLKVPVPNDYIGLFADCFQLVIAGKIKASLKK